MTIGKEKAMKNSRSVMKLGAWEAERQMRLTIVSASKCTIRGIIVTANVSGGCSKLTIPLREKDLCINP